MQSETIQLETLRQKIEDALYESAMNTEMLERGAAGSDKEKKRESVTRLDSQAKALKEELKELLTRLRSQIHNLCRSG
jgi:hypothetical protein